MSIKAQNTRIAKITCGIPDINTIRSIEMDSEYRKLFKDSLSRHSTLSAEGRHVDARIETEYDFLDDDITTAKDHCKTLDNDIKRVKAQLTHLDDKVHKSESTFHRYFVIWRSASTPAPKK